MQFPFHFPAVTLIVYNKRTTAEHREAELEKKTQGILFRNIP